MGMIEDLHIERGNCGGDPCIYLGSKHVFLPIQIQRCMAELIGPVGSVNYQKAMQSKRVADYAKSIHDNQVLASKNPFTRESDRDGGCNGHIFYAQVTHVTVHRLLQQDLVEQQKAQEAAQLAESQLQAALRAQQQQQAAERQRQSQIAAQQAAERQRQAQIAAQRQAQIAAQQEAQRQAALLLQQQQEAERQHQAQIAEQKRQEELQRQAQLERERQQQAEQIVLPQVVYNNARLFPQQPDHHVPANDGDMQAGQERNEEEVLRLFDQMNMM